MEFKRKGPEVAEVTCNDGTRVLFSYGEPVALWDAKRPPYGVRPRGYLRTERYVSRTTENHIASFVGSSMAEKIPHAEIQNAVKEAH